MPELIAATLLWALSFGLIKHQLAGVDPNLVAWARLALALPVLLPFLRWRELSLWSGRPERRALGLLAIGAVQTQWAPAFRTEPSDVMPCLGGSVTLACAVTANPAVLSARRRCAGQPDDRRRANAIRGGARCNPHFIANLLYLRMTSYKSCSKM